MIQVNNVTVWGFDYGFVDTTFLSSTYYRCAVYNCSKIAFAVIPEVPPGKTVGVLIKEGGMEVKDCIIIPAARKDEYIQWEIKQGFTAWQLFKMVIKKIFRKK